MNYLEMSTEEVNKKVHIILGLNTSSVVPDYCNLWEKAGPVITDKGISISPEYDADGNIKFWVAGYGCSLCKTDNPCLSSMIVLLLEEGFKLAYH